jgi:hypothetical protein
MSAITREQLAGYLDDTLSDHESALIEQALRASEALRGQLRALMLELDRGEHSLGAIWRRRRLTCPTREQIGSFLLQVLEPDLQDYVDFHLHTIGCSYCLANLADLRARQQEPPVQVQQRRKRIFESSAGLLTGQRRNKG